MKRLLLVLTLLAGIAAFTAATAGAAEPMFSLTGPSTATLGQTVTLSGVANALDGTDLSVYVYDTTCEESFFLYEDDAIASVPTTAAADGAYSADYTPLAAGVYSFWSASFGIWSDDCVDLTVTQALVPSKPSNETASSYLCWNREMVDPVAYIDKVADEMWATGKYFEPQAILGNVAGGTNIGAYHLVCNAPSTMKATDQALGGSGEVFNGLDTGLYHAEHTLNANDLNVYHIWK